MPIRELSSFVAIGLLPLQITQHNVEAGEGRIVLEEFATNHLEILDGAAHADTFLALMQSAMTNRG
jgi:hypothetical protein